VCGVVVGAGRGGVWELVHHSGLYVRKGMLDKGGEKGEERERRT